MAIVQNCDCTKRIPEKTERVVSVIIKLMGLPGRLDTPFVKSYLRTDMSQRSPAEFATLLPELPVSIERTTPVSVEDYVVSAKCPCGGHVQIIERKAVGPPIRDVGAPLSAGE